MDGDGFVFDGSLERSLHRLQPGRRVCYRLGDVDDRQSLRLRRRRRLGITRWTLRQSVDDNDDIDDGDDDTDVDIDIVK